MAQQIWLGTTDTAWTTITNWASGAAPSNGDSILIPATATRSIAGAAIATTLLSVTVEDGYSGSLGTSSAVPLSLVLLHGGAYGTFTFNTSQGTTHFVKLMNPGKIIVNGAPASPGTGLYGLNIQSGASGDDANTIVNINCDSNQSVGLAANVNQATPETGEFDTITVTGGTVTIGSGVTMTDGNPLSSVTVYGGTVYNSSATVTVVNRGGKYYGEAGAVTTISTYTSGTTYYNAATWTTCNINDSGVVDCRDSSATRTITTLHFYGKGGKFYDPYAIVTQTNPFQVHDYQLSDVTVQVGNAKKFTVAAI